MREGALAMSDQVRIYSGDTVKVVSLDKNRGLTMGEGAAYQYPFPKNSCLGSSIHFSIRGTDGMQNVTEL